MGFEKILNEKSILKYLNITIDGEELIKDDIITMEFKQNIDVFGITGTLKIKDSFDINNSGPLVLNGNNLVSVSMTDFHGTKSTRTYRIINTVVDVHEERFKIYEFTLLDEITFILQNLYISKSFNDTPVNALKAYLSEYGVFDLLNNNRLSNDIVDTSTIDTFVVPQNISVLDFFISKLREENIKMWQDRFGLHIKKLDICDLVVDVDPIGNNIVYSNKTINNEYAYKIHDYQESKNRTETTNFAKPVQRIFRYDTDKEIIDTTRNLIDVIGDIKLNGLDASGLQLTQGEKYDAQSIFTTGNQDYDLFDIYTKNNQLFAAVPGNLQSSNIGGIADVEMKGNISTPDAALKGDVLTSGKYFIGAVSDKIIGDKFMQRLAFYRVDAKVPR